MVNIRITDFVTNRGFEFEHAQEPYANSWKEHQSVWRKANTASQNHLYVAPKFKNGQKQVIVTPEELGGTERI